MKHAGITMEQERQGSRVPPPAGAVTRHRLRFWEALAAVKLFVSVLLCVAALVALLLGARLAVFSYLQWGHLWPASVAHKAPHDVR